MRPPYACLALVGALLLPAPTAFIAPVPKSALPSALSVRRGVCNFEAAAAAGGEAAAAQVDTGATKALPQAVIFDCDGVLADTERDGHRPAFNAAFRIKNLDCKWDVELYGKLLSVGGGKERMTAHFDGDAYNSADTCAICREPMLMVCKHCQERARAMCATMA